MPPTRFVDVGTCELAYWREGEGPDLVLIHGWPLHSATWRGVLPHLAPHFTCHLLDLPGAGETRDTAETPKELDAHAAMVGRAIDDLGLDEYALMAHDSGAVVARLVARDHGRRVFGLVMGNTEIPNFRSMLIRMLILSGSTGLGRRTMPMVMRSPWLRRSRLGFGTCFDDPALIDGEFFAHFLEPVLASPERQERQMRIFEGFDWSLVDDLARIHGEITAPAQLLWGRGDPWFPLKAARQMTGQFGGGCELVELPGKLFVHEEHPRKFAEAATEFLSRVRTAVAGPG